MHITYEIVCVVCGSALLVNEAMARSTNSVCAVLWTPCRLAFDPETTVSPHLTHSNCFCGKNVAGGVSLCCTENSNYHLYSVNVHMRSVLADCVLCTRDVTIMTSSS